MTGSTTLANCPQGEDFSPCTCDGGDNTTLEGPSWSIFCIRVHLVEVRSIFNRANEALNLTRFELIPSPIGDGILSIPVDVLGQKVKVTQKLNLFCPNRDYRLMIDREAFRSSKSSTKEVIIGNCNLSRLEWHFLIGFDDLESLSILSSTNLHQIKWADLPALPELSIFRIRQSQGLNEFSQTKSLQQFRPTFVHGLTEVYLGSNGLRDQGLDQILSWISNSSAGSLKVLGLDNNALNRIPSHIVSRFKKLEDLDVSYNKIQKIPRGMFNFSSPVKRLDLSMCPLNNLEPDAFQGKIFITT